MPKFMISAQRIACAVALALGVQISLASSPALEAQGAVPVLDRQYPEVVRKLIQGAKSTIEFQIYQARFYEEYPDTVTNAFLRDMIAAAQRGVTVRVVIDTGEWNPSNKNETNLDFVDRLTTAGIQVWEDSPTDVSHQKVITVDGNLTLVASTNWSFYSTDRNHEAGILLQGPEVAKYFRTNFWRHVAAGKPRNNATAVQESEVIARVSDPVAAKGQLTLADVLGSQSSPLTVEAIVPADNRHFYPVVRDAILSATQSIIVVQRSIKMEARASGGEPLPGQPASAINVFVDMLIGAAKRGVSVTVVLDKTTGFEATENDQTARRLMEGGVKVVMDDPDNQTHAKFLVIDDRMVIVGSTNWTRPAVENGNEASVLVLSPAVNQAFREYIRKLTVAGGPYTPEAPPSLWKEEPKAKSGD